MEYTPCEVAKHKSDIDGYWIYIKKKVYDLTPLCKTHRGDNIVKNAVLRDQNQKDLIMMHKHINDIKNKIKKYYIGKLVKCKDKTCEFCFSKKC